MGMFVIRSDGDDDYTFKPHEIRYDHHRFHRHQLPVLFIPSYQLKVINSLPPPPSHFRRLRAKFASVRLSDYITFNSMRNYGFLNSQPVTEQIYIHSKLMIVDDRRVIIGARDTTTTMYKSDTDDTNNNDDDDDDVVKKC